MGYHVVQSLPFSCVSATLVLANALFIGYQTDLRMALALKKHPEEEPDWLATVNVAFVVCFSIESVMRIAGLRLKFVFGEDALWNLFDLLVVTISLAEYAFQDFANVTFLRVLRMIRIVRVVRIIRVLRFFRELRMLMCCVFSSFWLLGWAMMLMGLLMYVFAIIILQAASLDILISDDPSATQALISYHWHSVPKAIFSMLMAISGGVEWEKIIAPLDNVSWLCRPAFAAYVVFVSFGIANIINGVFVFKVQDLNKHDRDLVVQASMADADAFIHQVRFYLAEQDISGDNLTMAQLRRFIENDEVWAYMKTHGLEVHDIMELYKRLDTGEQDKVDIEQFVFGCMRLKGAAKGSDVISILEIANGMQCQIQMLLDQARTSDRVCQQTFEKIEMQLAETRFDVAEIARPLA